MTKKASEVESQVKVVLSKVEKLRTAHEERQKVSENNPGQPTKKFSNLYLVFLGGFAGGGGGGGGITNFLGP